MTMPGRSCVALRLLMLNQVLSDGFRKFRQLRQARNNSRRTEGKTRPVRINSIKAGIRDGQSGEIKILRAWLWQACQSNERERAARHHLACNRPGFPGHGSRAANRLSGIWP